MATCYVKFQEFQAHILIIESVAILPQYITETLAKHSTLVFQVNTAAVQFACRAWRRLVGLWFSFQDAGCYLLASSRTCYMVNDYPSSDLSFLWVFISRRCASSWGNRHRSPSFDSPFTSHLITLSFQASTLLRINEAFPHPHPTIPPPLVERVHINYNSVMWPQNRPSQAWPTMMQSALL